MWSVGAALKAPWSQGQTWEATRVVAQLPAYQVALWPDGWEQLDDGAVLVRDTDAMAEARRWYRLAERNRGLVAMDPAMRLHGAFVPRPILAMSRHRFASAQVASVAVQLVAGDWVATRRAELLRAPVRALRERNQTWSGSRSREPLDREGLAAVLRDLLAQCAAERLIPRAAYRLRVLGDDGFGIGGFRCIVEVWLDPYVRTRLADALSTGLVPWNRVVTRDGRPHPLIGVEVRRPTAPLPSPT
jgi:hypothetical protein